MTNTASSRADLVRLSSEIVSAYVVRNAVPVAQLPDLVGAVHAALGTLGRPVPVVVAGPPKPSPAEIKRSIAPDGLTSFLDGRSYTMLKRHLARHDLTPAEYRSRFELPKDYPMVAPDYAAKRSALARAAGLGTRRQRLDAPESPADTEGLASSLVAPTEAEPKRRGRTKATAKSANAAPTDSRRTERLSRVPDRVPRSS